MRPLVTIFFLIQSSVLICQNIITVCALETTPAQYHTLQEAVDAASSGDIIHVLPSPSALTGATIDKSITILGPGHSGDIVSGMSSQVDEIELSNVEDVLIEGLVITKVTITDGAYANDITVRRNRFVGNGKFIDTKTQSSVVGTDNLTIEGNVFTPDTPPNSTPILFFNENDNNVVFQNNYVDCYYTYQRLVQGKPASSTFHNNLIYMRHGTTIAEGNGDHFFHSNIFYVASGSPDFNTGCQNCTFQGNLFYAESGFLEDPQEWMSTNTMNEEPDFVSTVIDMDHFDDNNSDGVEYAWSYADDYQLQLAPTSPGVGSGLYGQDVGFYGNLYDFNMNGSPSGVPVITSFSKAYDILPVDAPLEIDIEVEISE